jgi:hypothetical protein
MLLVILAVVQIVLLAVLVILVLARGRKDLQNSVPELLTGLAALRNSAERLDGRPTLPATGRRETELKHFSTKVRFNSVDVPCRRAP